MAAPTKVERLPHPIPYQGSKRLLAPAILGTLGQARYRRLYEPFAGSAAITLAAARRGVARSFAFSDSLAPLVEIWKAILSAPDVLAARYESVWRGQHEDADHYNTVRAEFNTTKEPAKLLYLLARCVKNAARFNHQGDFNQSPDHRRCGTHPNKMRQEILGAHALLRRRAEVTHADFADSIATATSADLVYMDPPYQGVSGARDTRYHQGLARERLIEVLADLRDRRVTVLLSYDGRCGEKSYGEPLPDDLGLVRYDLNAGRSTQSTLNGGADETVESLYVSRSLVAGSGSHKLDAAEHRW